MLISGVISAQLTAAKYSVKSLDANSKYSDFGTTFFGKDKIVFSSSRQTGTANKKKDAHDRFYLDLYIGNVGGKGEIIKVKPTTPSSTKYSKYMLCAARPSPLKVGA